MSGEVAFTKENLEYYLKELAKEFRKRGHGISAEMVLVGGAALLLHYGFRASSYDIDAAYAAPSVMKEAINAVGDRLGLPVGWVNDDFKRTVSYTPKIVQYSEYYKTFSGVLIVRTVRAEYLVAMKLMSGRKYKKDISDIAGILFEQQAVGKPLTREMIDRALCDLYGSRDGVSPYAAEMLDKILTCEDLGILFAELGAEEADAKDILAEAEQKYPGMIREDNADAVIAAALKKKQQEERS